MAKLHQAEKAAEELAEAKPAEPAKQSPAPKRVKSEQGIIVEGLDNCLVKFSKCCTPVPGDPIVGFITRGYGVSVHRQDCPNAAPERQKEAPGRWLKVSWGEDTHETYSTDLELLTKDRDGMLMDVSTAFSTTKTNIRGLTVKTTADGFALISATVQVADKAQLDQVMTRLHQISGIIKVSRPAG